MTYVHHLFIYIYIYIYILLHLIATLALRSKVYVLDNQGSHLGPIWPHM
jgi:hypothetical protein